ncbi:hypothetical protein K2173_004800 [Erythroxylum novogranatense]|uniref:DYW domain-containing protein n=1 Tax=Erythroxylum novogranatense TaxID=1862640 RepID=A0AAV8SJS2_9ROSI|nr:hypothetical protein K2173_004800 [Erythroxylum novogranatense]
MPAMRTVFKLILNPSESSSTELLELAGFFSKISALYPQSSPKSLALAKLSRKLPLFHSKVPLPFTFVRQNIARPKFISTIPLSWAEGDDEREQYQERSKNVKTNLGGFVSLSDHPNPEVSCFYQKGFSQITKEVTGKALHALCIKGLIKLNVFYINTLISMYSKLDQPYHALYVFDKMDERNEASWSNMMSGLVRVGLYHESVGLFNQMRGFGISPTGFAIASLITACERSKFMVSEGTQVHNFIVKAGLLCDVFVGTSLLHFYGSYGSVYNANKIFEEMPQKNVVSWTALMIACLHQGDPGDVMRIFNRMKCEGVSCNANTFATVFCSCGLFEVESMGHQALAQVLKCGLETNVSVANSLISMFGSLGSLRDACSVFNGMKERDTISWNSIISAHVHDGHCEESLGCFHLMRHVHNKIDGTTLSTLLSGSGTIINLKWGRGIHCLVVKLGYDLDICVCNTLICMYSDAGKSEDAESLFQFMGDRDLISWNSMIACYAQDGRCLDALKVFFKIFHSRKNPNFVTFTSAISACLGPEFATEGKSLHAFVILKGLHDNLIVGNALITMYAKCGMMVEAQKVFESMTEQNEVTWNALIGGYADNNEQEDAVKAFKLMRIEGVTVDYITLAHVVGACKCPNALMKLGMPLHAYVVLTGFESDMYVHNSLIKMYANCGSLNNSRCIFNEVTNRTPITWNAIIAANAQHGHEEEALKLLLEMRHGGVDLDQYSISECLGATAKLAILEEGQQLHSLAVKLGLDSNHFVRNATMDMYGKCGEIDDVLRIIPDSIERSRLSWNILISSYARLGYFEKAKETFQDMLELGVKPDHVTFVSLLSACSHGGLVEEGLAYFHSMMKEFGVPAGIEHCVCIVDLLGRSGRFREAESFIQKMPVPPTDLVWRSLLAACKTHKNHDLGRKAAENLFKIDSLDDSAYVLYSNVCATTGRWEDVETVRRQMESNNIKKKPASSWVKLKDNLSSFGIGDRSHPQTSEIYSKLAELKKMIKEAGYVPDTSYALHDTDEEQKEQNLWTHSERLALAFGLINTPERATIKVFKNLRVCGDCHSVYKLVCGILQRQIILRDPYRFHHFNGDASFNVKSLTRFYRAKNTWGLKVTKLLPNDLMVIDEDNLKLMRLLGVVQETADPNLPRRTIKGQASSILNSCVRLTLL